MRVLSVAPMPPEKIAYALARYSRSPDSIRESIEWVRTHDSSKFLESFYFQYGHASIADLGHVTLCFEGISELAATEVEDEPLWDGQARSTRYQAFGTTPVITPPEFNPQEAAEYQEAAGHLLAGYRELHGVMIDHLTRQLPRPESMKPEVYERNIAARAFDVARYLLPLGIPTGVGQVTSIRTLEKQIRRFKASPYAELRALADEVAASCSQPPACSLGDDSVREALAPTLARHVEADVHAAQASRDLKAWARENLKFSDAPPVTESSVDLLKPADTSSEIAATLLYPVTARPFRELYEMALSWNPACRREVIDVALQSRTRKDELLRGFRGSLYCFDIVMDVGAYRDLHRHRRCHQFRQEYDGSLGWETPEAVYQAGWGDAYTGALKKCFNTVRALPDPGRQYLFPFATRGRFLFKMDLAEAEYVSRLRSGVKGHFSYRQIAWAMKEKLAALEPDLQFLLQATPPWQEDPLTR